MNCNIWTIRHTLPIDHVAISHYIRIINSTESDMSPAYKAAYDKHNAAYRVYEPIRKAYNAGEISDTEYLAARKIYDAATAEFDKAFAAEQNTA